MVKSAKPEAIQATTGSTRLIDASDTARFVAAADAYVSANTVSSEAARDKLKELGFITQNGKPKKPYR
jgi:hypothetical protein